MNRPAIIGVIAAAVLVTGVIAVSSNLFTTTVQAAKPPSDVVVTNTPLPVQVTNFSTPPAVLPAACPSANVQHWDKIIFIVTDDISGHFNANLLNKKLDIKVLDHPALVADLDQKVKGFLGTNPQVEGSGAHVFDPPESFQPGDVNALTIEIDDIEYAIICALP